MAKGVEFVDCLSAKVTQSETSVLRARAENAVP